MESIQSLWKRVGKSKRLSLALLLPALPFLALILFMPSQFAFVVEDAADRVLPLAWATGAMLVYFALLLLMLLGAGVLDRFTLALAAALPVAVLLSFLAGAGIHFSLLSAALLPVALIVFAAWKLEELCSLRLPPLLRSVWLPLTAGTVIFLGAGIASAQSPLVFPRTVGSLAILMTFAGVVALWLEAMALRAGLAIVTVAYACVAVLLFSPNNHEIPVRKAKTAPLGIEETFVRWLGSRADLEGYRSRGMPYPVIIVSSEGGGIYAAAHAYGTLSTIGRNCPTFNQHIFAAVGVSGGAIGNALYAAAADPVQKPYASCSTEGAGIDPAPMITDHLSPVVARLLLLESVDQLLPGQWVEHDRGQVLTDSFLSVSGDKAHSDAAVTDSYDPKGARPALVAVTTDRNTGNRLVIAPFQPEFPSSAAKWWPGTSPFENASQLDERIQISTVSAAGLSARFPWVTPTGRLKLSDTEARILADGGYFDNSGAETVTDLVDALKFKQNWSDFWRDVDARQSIVGTGCEEVSIRIIRNFHAGDDGVGRTRWGECEIPIFLVYFALASQDEGNADTTDQSFLRDPVTVLLQSRSSRGDNALDYADLYYCGLGTGSSGSECSAVPGNSPGMFRNDIQPRKWGLPLGWFMSGSHFDKIVSGTAAEDYFDFRRRGNPAETETELMIYHLDPALYDEGSKPSISELFANFGP